MEIEKMYFNILVNVHILFLQFIISKPSKHTGQLISSLLSLLNRCPALHSNHAPLYNEIFLTNLGSTYLD